MGAAVAIEIQKPLDASDILARGSLEYAQSEVIRLRKELGHLASIYGVSILSMDASDLVKGDCEKEDFERCVQDIAHIRKCLVLNTQTSKRRERNRQYTSITAEDTKFSEGKDSTESNDYADESSSSEEDNT